MDKNKEVIFEVLAGRDGDLGLITLNRPAVLNAINQEMFLALDEQLATWEQAQHIKAVVIQACPGRAFCAGGDIRSTYERALAHDPSLSAFFGKEYRLNQRIYHYPKPYIALLDGITMGGGVGLSIHGSHRVATNRLVFAMPETGIGFFPDVGATYFLPRLPKKIGFYLGLSGAHISVSDCFALGIVNHLAESDSLSDIIQALAETSLEKNPDVIVTETINAFSVPVEKSALMDRQVEIETCFSKNTVEEIMQALEYYPSAWCEQTAAILSTKSPTSLKVTLRQLQTGIKLNFDECMALEYQLTKHFVQGHDFYEGVRAAIIDKDQSPQWQPSELSAVKVQDVEKYFSGV